MGDFDIGDIFDVIGGLVQVIGGIAEIANDNDNRAAGLAQPLTHYGRNDYSYAPPRATGGPFLNAPMSPKRRSHQNRSNPNPSPSRSEPYIPRRLSQIPLRYSTIAKAGWMHKYGASALSTLRRRYFVLVRYIKARTFGATGEDIKQYLLYFEDDTMKLCKGKIDVSNVRGAHINGQNNTFTMRTHDRVWSFQTDTNNEANCWRDHLAGCERLSSRLTWKSFGAVFECDSEFDEPEISRNMFEHYVTILQRENDLGLFVTTIAGDFMRWDRLGETRNGMRNASLEIVEELVFVLVLRNQYGVVVARFPSPHEALCRGFRDALALPLGLEDVGGSNGLDDCKDGEEIAVAAPWDGENRVPNGSRAEGETRPASRSLTQMIDMIQSIDEPAEKPRRYQDEGERETNF